MKKYKQLVKEAEELARNASTWADLSNDLFSPGEGILSRAFPSRAQRIAFMKSAEYERIWTLLSEAMDKHGFVAGATPKKSGKFVVRLPQSLHAALEREAHQEGVSLNQLVVTKLAVQLKDATRRTTRRA